MWVDLLRKYERERYSLDFLNCLSVALLVKWTICSEFERNRNRIERKKYMGNLRHSKPFFKSIIIYTAQSAFSREKDDATFYATEWMQWKDANSKMLSTYTTSVERIQSSQYHDSSRPHAVIIFTQSNGIGDIVPIYSSFEREIHLGKVWTQSFYSIERNLL